LSTHKSLAYYQTNPEKYLKAGLHQGRKSASIYVLRSTQLDSYNRSTENLSLTFYTRVIEGLVFGVVHPSAISFFSGPNVEPDSETGLHHFPK
jgi:hypothetical protein